MTNFGEHIMTTAIPVTVHACATPIPMHVVSTPCGLGWGGMTQTDDLTVQVRRALAHVDDCETCRSTAADHVHDVNGCIGGCRAAPKSSATPAG